ncbi:hypothetical protein BV22DRAFT_1051529 [Leucogyrophana mollusca]|uniref:Uncharacterized protein n=1 Tax=Leucogyrophana mollusca TaxID=85980 RepID=A0ACB8AZQ8_9AGAM|nr:hypothetical protein BV22DRAFT_1051529 [Leucogyrophana mollusca]
MDGQQIYIKPSERWWSNQGPGSHNMGGGLHNKGGKLKSGQSEVLAQAFFPPPPAILSVPIDFEYPEPIANFEPITEDHIARSIAKLSPYKAPGLNRTCNMEFTTVVLCKPGKPDYSVPKVYHPIALLNTTSKLLSSIVVD